MQSNHKGTSPVTAIQVTAIQVTAIQVTAILVTGMALFAALCVPAQAASNHHAKKLHVSATLRFARSNERPNGAPHRHHTGFAPLIGDRQSGFGFYPPAGRAYAYRYGRGYDRQTTKEAMREALINQGAYSFYGTGGGVPSERHAHSMFNPVDGYGTPFFAGYYGPAGDPDEDRGPFGKPYND
jgi:hypothetical protein